MKTSHFHLSITLFAAIAIALSGCAPVELPGETPGEITKQYSSYDEATRYSLTPTPLFSPDDGVSAVMTIGLYYAGNKDWIFIEAETWGVALIEKMGVKIDGEFIELLPDGGAINTDMGVVSPIYGRTVSKARFKTTPDLIRRINRADNVIVRLHTSTGLVDGDFKRYCGESTSLTTTACDGFAKFMSEVVDGNGNSE